MRGFSDRAWRWSVPAAVAAAVLVRLAVMAPALGRLDDPDRYLVVAHGLVDGAGFAVDGRPTAYRPPLYPLMLAGLLRAFGESRLAWSVGALHLALGAGTVALSAVAARRWGLSRGRILAAAAIVAFDPVLTAQSRAVMTETTAAFLVAAALAALAGGRTRDALLGGVGLGMASLCRPSLLPVAGLVALAGLACGPGGRRARLERAVLVLAATGLMLVPWAWRNARVLGEPVWTTTHGGWTLALANNLVYYAEVLDGPPGAVWSGENQLRWFMETVESVAGLPEPAADRRIRENTLRFIAGRPRAFLRASAARLGRFWAVAPAGAVYSWRTRLATLVWTLPLWVALGLGLTTRSLWRWPRATAPAFVLALSAVHAVYWTDMRMRAPILPAIALISAAAERPGRGGRTLAKSTVVEA